MKVRQKGVTKNECPMFPKIQHSRETKKQLII